MGAIYRREMGAFFSSPIAYIVLAVFYLFSGYFFYQSSILYSVSNLSSAFSAMFLVIVFIIPIMTMKLISEEKKQKTDQGLLTAPIKLSSIVLGKYFAALTLYVFAVSIFLVFALILQFYGGVQWSEVFSNYIALILLGSAFIGISLFISSLTENQVIAAIGGFVGLMVCYLLDTIATSVTLEPLSKLLSSLSFFTRYTEFTTGLFNYSSILYFVSTAVVFNFLTVRVLEKRRWS